MPGNRDQRIFLRNFVLGFLLAGVVIVCLYYMTGSMDTTGNILIVFSITVGAGSLLFLLWSRLKKRAGKS